MKYKLFSEHRTKKPKQMKISRENTGNLYYLILPQEYLYDQIPEKNGSKRRRNYSKRKQKGKFQSQR